MTTTMTQSSTRRLIDSHPPATTAALVVLFWLAAAGLVWTAHTRFDTRSSTGGAIFTVVAIVGTAFAYTRIHPRGVGVTHALGVGVAWLLLAIGTEMAMTEHLGHHWFALLGTPDRPLLRNIFLFVWVFAPALFAQREER